MMRAFTSTSDDEISECLTLLKSASAGTGFMHESFNKDNVCLSGNVRVRLRLCTCVRMCTRAYVCTCAYVRVCDDEISERVTLLKSAFARTRFMHESFNKDNVSARCLCAFL